MTPEELQLLRRVRNYLLPSNVTTLQYIPPAQQLRNAADELEQKEADHEALEELITKYSKDAS